MENPQDKGDRSWGEGGSGGMEGRESGGSHEVGGESHEVSVPFQFGWLLQHFSKYCSEDTNSILFPVLLGLWQ